MRLDHTVTGIATIEANGINVYTGKIYDLSGREVSVPRRGNVYITGSDHDDVPRNDFDFCGGDGNTGDGEEEAG